MQSKNNMKIGIIGLGLIGGSLAKVLAASGYRVFGVAHSDATLTKALELDIFEKVTQSIESLNGCSIIFVAVPINKIEIIFRQIEDSIKSPCIVTDVASIKADVTALADKVFDPARICFIPGHPMAGTEHKGIDASFVELFKGARWVICPRDPKRKAQLDLLTSVIQETGAHIVFCNPETHDMAVALISHMPLLVSMGLIETINVEEDIVLKENAYFLAASGFRDSTRIAGGNAELSYDMLMYNKENVIKALEIYQNSLAQLKELLNKDKETIISKFEEISEIRQKLYSETGANIFRGLFG
jgi:arogenate dehydrogenase (NADP+)